MYTSLLRGPDSEPAPRWRELVRRAGAWCAVAGRHTTAGVVEGLWRRLRHGEGRGVMVNRWTRMLVELGPTFVKGGQLLSTRKDLLPVPWCEAMGRLHDRVGPMPTQDAERALARAYPPIRPWPFDRFDWTPVASGSIACVYRARLCDGRDVAVKLRRPDIGEHMRADLALLGVGATVIQHLPGMRTVPVRRMVDQVGFAILRQLDFDQEADSLLAMRSNLSTLSCFRIPQAIAEASGEGAMVMEFVEGLERFSPGELTREQRREIVRRLLQGVYRMLFIDGLVHCDMHPGNLYLNKAAEVVLLDAGFVISLSPTVRQLFAKFFLNMSLGLGQECAEVVLRSAEHVPQGCDIEVFRRGVIELVQANHRRTAGQFRLAPFAARLFDLQRRSGIAAAPEFVFPLVSLLVLEGMINEFDVNVDFQAEAIPTLLTALRAA
jgi:ubiquinone biosynthesis protein